MGSWNAFGDIDIASAPTFATDLCAMIDVAEIIPVEVDCGSITFIDSAGFYAFVAADRHARERHHTLVIANLAPFHAKVIELCDWDHELTLAPTGGRTSTR